MNRIVKELYRDAAAEIAAAKAKKATARELRVPLGKIDRALKALEKKGKIKTPFFYGGARYASVSVTVEGLDGFGGTELLSILEKLSNAGGIEFTESNDSAEYGCRNFSGYASDTRIRVSVAAYLKEEAARCKRVLKGVEKVDRFIYEFECA